MLPNLRARAAAGILMGSIAFLVGPAKLSVADAAPKIDAGHVNGEVDITFSGFQSLGGGRGILFVELTGLVPVEVSRKGQVIEYNLMGAHVRLRNNKNPLLLRDFGSSALSAVLVPGKKAVRFVVTLRGNVTPIHRMIARGKGAALEIELPAG